ncbi:MAG: ABC transporter substrate-binding protein, partial [Akkermansia sp.]
MLAEAGYPEGKNFPTLELTTTSREVQRIMGECIQAFWLQNLGIRVQIQVKEWTAYKAAQQNGEYDFSSSAWSGDFLDPSNFVELWISGGGNN